VTSRWVSFDVSLASESPFDQFDRWFEEAREIVREPEAITLVTASLAGRPSARMVLLRHRSERGFGFFTNFNSQKGSELEENPHAAMLWYVEALGRQVRIEGPVERLDATVNDAYFSSRPRGHQIGAHASEQSSPLESRQELELRVAQLTEEYEGRAIPRPEYWGGFQLVAQRFEFWQHREDRLHDRVIYVANGSLWHRERLSP
jgi:pyridoxamine 5'-phosphate oxidase